MLILKKLLSTADASHFFSQNPNECAQEKILALCKA